MDIFELSRMIKEDIQITYSHETEKATASIINVRVGVGISGDPAMATAGFPETALENLCALLEDKHITVLKDYGPFVLKLELMRLDY